jgi:hypothetical protein
MLGDERSHCFPGRIRRALKRRSSPIAGGVLFKQPALREAAEQPLEHRLHRFCHAKRAGRNDSSRSVSEVHFPQPAGELRGREVIARGQGGFKPGATSRRDHLLERLPGYVLQPRQWDWLLRRRPRDGGRSLPCHMVEDVATSQCS